MAVVSAYPNGNGAIVQFYPAPYGLVLIPPVDPAATLTVNFDESTNSALIADLETNLGLYTIVLVNSVPTLEKSGAPVTIAAPSALYALQSTILNGVPDATLRAYVVALWNGTATNAQAQKALAYVLLKLDQAGII